MGVGCGVGCSVCLSLSCTPKRWVCQCVLFWSLLCLTVCLYPARLCLALQRGGSVSVSFSGPCSVSLSACILHFKEVRLSVCPMDVALSARLLFHHLKEVRLLTCPSACFVSMFLSARRSSTALKMVASRRLGFLWLCVCVSLSLSLALSVSLCLSVSVLARGSRFAGLLLCLCVCLSVCLLTALERRSR